MTSFSRSMTVRSLIPTLLAIVAATPSMLAQQTEALVDVGGYRLFISCSGASSPTVVLEAGLGGSSKSWDKVAPEVARFARVCRYDRPGEGRSDPAPRSIRRVDGHRYIELRPAREVTGDLHTLLTKAGVAAPIVIVGHSIGGLFAILYAAQYPRDVVGMVLVDASHPDQVAREKALMTPEQARRDRAELQQNEEGFDIDDVFAAAKAARWHSEIPLGVVVRGLTGEPPAGWSADAWARKYAVWRELQADHARRSPNATLVVAERSGHGIQNDQPDLVVDAIRRVVVAAAGK